MISITVSPTKHMIIIDSLKAQEIEMRKNNLDLAANMVKEIIDEISLETLEDKSKSINEKS